MPRLTPQVKETMIYKLRDCYDDLDLIKKQIEKVQLKICEQVDALRGFTQPDKEG